MLTSHQELKNFQSKHDDELKSLNRLLKSDSVMKRHKVLIFAEFAETARYLKKQLDAAGITSVEQTPSRARRPSRVLLLPLVAARSLGRQS